MNAVTCNALRFVDGTEMTSASSDTTPTLESLTIGEFNLALTPQDDLLLSNSNGNGIKFAQTLGWT